MSPTPTPAVPPEYSTKANTIYVGNISQSAKEEDLYTLFSQLTDHIVGVTWATDRKKGRFKGYAPNK